MALGQSRRQQWLQWMPVGRDLGLFVKVPWNLLVISSKSNHHFEAKARPQGP
jgi:hypothetical protein